MPTREDPCQVCGTVPSVRSHIFPRALAHDLRRNEKHLIAIARDAPRATYMQSGLAYHGLLCAEHEAALAAADDYGVDLIRLLSGPLPAGEGETTMFRNDRPDLAEAFALACLWRTVRSDHGQRNGLDLGRYDSIIAARLFHGTQCDLPVLAARSGITLKGSEVAMQMLPHRVRLQGLNAWRMFIDKVELYIITDARKSPWPELLRFDRALQVAFVRSDPIPASRVGALRWIMRK